MEDKFLDSTVTSNCSLTNFIQLDVGCGNDKRFGYIGIDKENFGQEYILDVEKEVLPFLDSSIDEIFCQHLLEHLTNPMFAINEFWRVLKPGGELIIIVPHKNSDRAYAIDHKHYFNEYSFDPLESQYEKKWFIVERTVNDRPDIYIKLKPIKN
jgi:predicted SAM-dependent methyltransferase